MRALLAIVLSLFEFLSLALLCFGLSYTIDDKPLFYIATAVAFLFIGVYCLVYNKLKSDMDKVCRIWFIVLSIIGNCVSIVVWLLFCFQDLYLWKDNLTDALLQII